MYARINIGTRLERIGDPTVTGTYASGADYVPGLDAGNFTVKLDAPAMSEYGHSASAHWTYDEMMRYWRVTDIPAPDEIGVVKLTLAKIAEEVRDLQREASEGYAPTSGELHHLSMLVGLLTPTA